MRDAAWVNSSLALPPTSAAPFASSATDIATTATTTATATVTAVAAAVTAVATANVPPAAAAFAAATGTGEALNFGANSYNTNGNNKSVPASAVTSEISKHTISSNSSRSVRRFLSGTWPEEEASEESETSRRRGTEGRGAEERRLLEGGAMDEEEEEEEEEEKLPMTPCQVSGIKGRWVLSKSSGFD
ncbi:unnamed protein product [Closterium sp. NIES-53]